MKTFNQIDSSEEIVIVASLYGDLGDVLRPIYEIGKPIEKNDIKELLGNEVVYLCPRDNYFDRYAVGVYTANQKLLGFIWMNQAPSIRHWMEINNKRYVAIHINRINTKERLIMAALPEGMTLERIERSAGIDDKWAKDLPLVVTSIKQQGLELGLFRLKDELESKTEWDDDIKTMIDNVMQYLESDLSDNCYGDCNDVCKLMRKSPVKVIREKADWFVQKLASRGTTERTQWWIDKWLPLYMKEAYEENLMSIYKESGYTLERIEDLLNTAPFDLFYLYKSDRVKFVNKLYYSVLPQRIFYRLLTLLAVWEKLKGVQEVQEVQTKKERVIDNKVLKKAVVKVQPFMWAASAYAVLYCVCRDKYGIPDNMSQFEREFSKSKTGYSCKEGSIGNTIRANSYMKMHIDRWEQNGAKERALILKNKFIEEVNNIVQA